MLAKLMSCAIVAAAVTAAGSLWYQVCVVGRLYDSASPLGVLLTAAFPVVVVTIGASACLSILNHSAD